MGLEKADDKDAMKLLVDEISEQIRLDNLVPENHPEREAFVKFEHYIRESGSVINKCKPRWVNPQ